MLYQLSYVGGVPKCSAARRGLTPATRARPYRGGMARAFVVSLLAVLAAAVLAGPAAAREVVLRDDQGRAMRFDVRADVDLGGTPACCDAHPMRTRSSA